MAKKKSKVSTYTFTQYQVFAFAAVFGLLGVYSAWSAFAQGNGRGGGTSTAVCNIPAETKLGAYYTGTISSIPTSSVINMYVTYGDGSQKVFPYQWTSSMELQYHDMGNWDGNGNKATVLGKTQIKLTGPTKQNEKTTQILATCSTNVVN